MNYREKYLKYKLKYLTAKKLYGGMECDSPTEDYSVKDFLEGLSDEELNDNMSGFSDGDMSPTERFLEGLPDEGLNNNMSEFRAVGANQPCCTLPQVLHVPENPYPPLEIDELVLGANQPCSTLPQDPTMMPVAVPTTTVPGFSDEDSEPVAHVDAGKHAYERYKGYYGSEEAVANTSLKTIVPMKLVKDINKLTKKYTMTCKERQELMGYRDTLVHMFNSIMLNTDLSDDDKKFHLDELKEWIDRADRFI